MSYLATGFIGMGFFMLIVATFSESYFMLAIAAVFSILSIPCVLFWGFEKIVEKLEAKENGVTS